MKKLFIVSSVLFIVILIFFGVYRFVFQDNATNPVADEKEKAEAMTKNEPAPNQGSNRLSAILQDSVVGAAIRNGKLVYYSKRDHSLKEADLEGKNQRVLSEKVSGIPSRILWSPRGDELLYFVEEVPNARWHFLSIKTTVDVPLRPEMSRLAWTNLGDSILYQFTDPAGGKGSLNIANPDGKNWKKLADFDSGSNFIAPVPQSSLISFWKRPNGLEQNKLETVNLSGEERKTLFSNRFGTDFLWSKNGDHILIGSVTEKGRNEPLLGVANSQGGEYRDLLLPSLISKVAWSQDNATLYYALPRSFPKETDLPNDYFSRMYPSKDTFWKMNIITGKRERLIPLEEMTSGLDATELFLNQDETALFFIDRTSEKLYRLEL